MWYVVYIYRVGGGGWVGRPTSPPLRLLRRPPLVSLPGRHAPPRAACPAAHRVFKKGSRSTVQHDYKRSEAEREQTNTWATCATCVRPVGDMASTYRLLTPRLLDDDLTRPGLKTETKLALQTLRTLLDRPDGVDDGVVRGQIDVALQDPAMGSSLLHTLFRSNDAQDAHVLFGALDTIERQIIARQQASRHDVRTMLQFARTVLLSPLRGDRTELRARLVQELMTSLSASDIDSTDTLTQAVERLTVVCGHTSSPTHPHTPTTPTVPMPVTAPSTGVPSPSITSQIGPGHSGGSKVASPVPVPVPMPMSMPPTEAAGVAPSSMVAVAPAAPAAPAPVTSPSTPLASAHSPVQQQSQPPPQPVVSTSPDTLEILQAINNDDADGDFGWLDTQLQVSPSASSSAGSSPPLSLPTVMRMQVVLLRDAEDRVLTALAERCGLLAETLSQFWYGQYPFDITPPLLSTLVQYPCCVQVPDNARVSDGGGSFELRVVSAYVTEMPEWDGAMHQTMMALCTLVLDEQRAPPPITSLSGSSSTNTTTHTAATGTLSRASLRAPGPVPSGLTPEMRCLHHLFEGLDVSRLIRDQVPLLRVRQVHSRRVLEWCIIIKTVDANGHVRVFRLNNKPNNRYASTTPSDLHFASHAHATAYLSADYTTSASGGSGGSGGGSGGSSGGSSGGGTGDLLDTFPYTHTLPTLRENEVHCDDGRLCATTFVVHPITRPSPLYTTNMFGGYLVCGWYTEHTTVEGTTTRFYVFRTAPRLVYIYRDLSIACV